jgi:hypothetical protein
MRALPLLACSLLFLAVSPAGVATTETLALDDPGWVSKVQVMGVDGGQATPKMDSANRLYARNQQLDAPCSSIVHQVVSVGTAAVTVPTTRTPNSIGVEIENSAENSGSPKLKCTADPIDGGVGTGLTNIGLVKNPGEPMYFGLDSSHSVKCISDTAGTAAVTSECVP